MSHSPDRRASILNRLAALPTGRRSAFVVLIAWIAIVAAISPLAAKLTDVQENETSQWLPGNAESLEVTRAQESFAADEAVPAVIIYHRDGGLTADDRQAIEQQRAEMTAKFPDTPPSEPFPSEDGHAVIVTIPLRSDGSNESFEMTGDTVDDLRAIVKTSPDGLQASVTGPAGFFRDFMSVFDGIDGTLLIATAIVVAVLLLITYRSPVLWLVPLISVGLALQVANATVYLLAEYAGISVNGQSAGILPVLVFGVGTDYALLLIARYREELRRHESPREAMAFALRQAAPAILASAATVTIGLLCLLAADLNPTRGLGPVGAMGIIAGLVAMLTLLPAILVIFGRRLFWPFVPTYGSETHEESGIWARIGASVSRRPRPVWIGTVLVLAIFALGLLGIDTNLPQDQQFRSEPEAIIGQKLLTQSYPAGAGSPTTVIANAGSADAVQAAIAQTSGVADVAIDGTSADGSLVSFSVTLDADPASPAAFDTVQRLRDSVHPVAGANAIVGGPDAQSYDIATTSARDRKVIIPLILLVVLIVLGLLLRSVVAPVILIATVILSFAGALGASTLIFDHVFGFAAVEASIPLLGFVFLVALGIDYNIFLMSRVHEESARLGTRRGMLKGLAVTGGVITSAGMVLAATFAVLGVLPLVSMTELGFLVAFGVLLDTLIVRSVLVPAITFELGPRIWLPSHLAKRAEPAGWPVGDSARVTGD